MDWITKLAECAIELLYIAAECPDAGKRTFLRKVSAMLDLVAKEAGDERQRG